MRVLLFVVSTIICIQSVISCPRIPDKFKRGVAVFNDQPYIGKVFLTQNGDNIDINGKIKGFKPNSIHGIHIHTFGDLRSKCEATGSDYDKYSNAHGGRHTEERHFGDLGNIETDATGEATFSFSVEGFLFKTEMIFGRSLVIHEKEDDLGKNNNPRSQANGNTGKNIACAVIGIRNLAYAT